MAMESKSFTALESDVGARLDKWLVGQLEMSRSKIHHLLDIGLIEINGKVVKPSAVLKLGDLVSIKFEEEKPVGPFPENIKLDIIFEDEFLILINKPAGMMVHSNNYTEQGTLVNALLY